MWIVLGELKLCCKALKIFPPEIKQILEQSEFEYWWCFLHNTLKIWPFSTVQIKEHHFPLHMSFLSSPQQKLPRVVYSSLLHCAQFSVSLCFCSTPTYNVNIPYQSHFLCPINNVSFIVPFTTLWCSSISPCMDKSLPPCYGKELSPCKTTFSVRSYINSYWKKSNCKVLGKCLFPLTLFRLSDSSVQDQELSIVQSIVQNILVTSKNLNSNKSSNTFHMLSFEISCSKRFGQLMEKSVLPVIVFRVGWFKPLEYAGFISTHWVNDHDRKLFCMIF